MVIAQGFVHAQVRESGNVKSVKAQVDGVEIVKYSNVPSSWNMEDLYVAEARGSFWHVNGNFVLRTEMHTEYLIMTDDFAQAIGLTIDEINPRQPPAPPLLARVLTDTEWNMAFEDTLRKSKERLAAGDSKTLEKRYCTHPEAKSLEFSS